MKSMKRMCVLSGLILASLLLSACVTEYFYDVAVKRKAPDQQLQSKDLASTDRIARNYQSDWFATAPHEDLVLVSADGLKLAGYYFPAPQATNKTVLIAHGYSGRAAQMSVFGEYFSRTLGYNVLLPDARGHGNSEGNYIGFGWPERKDWQQWIQLVLERHGPESRIVLFGISMGGATVMMTSGEELPPQVLAVVEDCGYTSAWDQLGYQLERLYGLPREPILADTSAYTKKRAGYSFQEASALEQVRKSRLPMLFIHGEADTFVPYPMVQELYTACPGPKELYVVPGAGHGQAWGVDPAAWQNVVGGFLARWVKD